MRVFYFLFVFHLIGTEVIAQCNPPSSDTCLQAYVFCSLDDFNNYKCKNNSEINESGCTPLCPEGGLTNNVSWWAFVTEGGQACISISVSNCSITGTGVQMGIWGDCDCNESIACQMACNSSAQYKICAAFDPCKTYYLFVDGCSGDVCDFTISTTSGKRPKLDSDFTLIGRETVCLGEAKLPYYIPTGNSTCLPNFNWFLDGKSLDSKNDTVYLSFPQEGIFNLCTEAALGYSIHGYCEVSSQKCKQILVTRERSLTYKDSNERIICTQIGKANIYNWFGLSIDTNGTYSQSFFKNCLRIDSIITVRFEKEFKNKLCPIGVSISKVNETFNYALDSFLSPEFQHKWTVMNGTILNSNPSSLNSVDVIWDFIPMQSGDYIGVICHSLIGACVNKEECCAFVQVKYSVGVDELNSESLILSPTLTQGVFFISGINNGEKVSIKIFNLKGILMFNQIQNSSSDNYILDLSTENLMKGIYLVEIRTATKMVTKKLIMP